jgi:Holliday junction resolvase RusA-like endonuclease
MVINKVSLPIKFEMDLPPSQIRGNNRSHHYTYNKFFQNYLNAAMGYIYENTGGKNYKTPFEKTLIIYTFMNNRSIDLDNFIYGMKAVQDALVHTGIIADDDALTISPIGKFVKCPINQRKVSIEIYDTTNYKKVAIWADSVLVSML